MPMYPHGLPPNMKFASLYVGDLHSDVTETTLLEAFGAVGNVASCRICRDSVTKKSLCYGYVNYYTVADAERAMDMLNYTKVQGKPCRVMWSQRDASLRKKTACNIFVKNLDRTIDNKALHDTFSMFGNILSCKVATDAHGKSKGYGFVHYEAEDAAKFAIARVNGMKIASTCVFVGPFMKREDLESTANAGDKFTNLYVQHIPEDWDDTKLTEVFGAYGEIVSSVIMTNKAGKRFALVNFQESEGARLAIEGLHRKQVSTDVGVKVAEAQASTLAFNAKKEETVQAVAGGESRHEETSEYKNNAKVEAKIFAADSEHVEVESESPREDPKRVTAESDIVVAGSVQDEADLAIAGMTQKEDAAKCEATGEAEVEENKAEDEEDKADVEAITKEVEGEDVPEHLLYVQRARTREERKAEIEQERERRKSERSSGIRIIVRNLTDTATSESLRRLFEPHGAVLSTVVRRDEETSKCRGFGFVIYSTMDEAAEAIAKMNSMTVDGKALTVALAEKKKLPRERGGAEIQGFGSGEAKGGTFQNITEVFGFEQHRRLQAKGAKSMATGKGKGGESKSRSMRSKGGKSGPSSTEVRPQLQHGLAYGTVPPYRAPPPPLGNTAPGDAPQGHFPSPSAGGPGALAPPLGATSWQGLPSLTSALQTSGTPTGSAVYSLSPAVAAQRAVGSGCGGCPTGVSPQTLCLPPQLGSPPLCLGGLQQAMALQQQAAALQAYLRPPVAPLQMRAQQFPTPVSSFGGGSATGPSRDWSLSQLALAALPPREQKQQLGERLFSQISRYRPAQAGKITGMMLELDNEELFRLIQSEEQLKQKINEAILVLERPK